MNALVDSRGALVATVKRIGTRLWAAAAGLGELSEAHAD